MKLNDMLDGLDRYPFHMPGHKRNSAFDLPSCDIDITEIDGFDNLHAPNRVIKRLEDDISRLYGSKKSFLSVNGSTCCVLAAVYAVCCPGDTVIIARNCHKSVYNACFLNRLNVVYIEPEYNEEFGICTGIDGSSVSRALMKNPRAKAVIITSPTYEGIVSKIESSVPVIIDAAHGSHFGFAKFLPDRQRGDIVINSFHKTLPCLTQTAAVHIYNEKYIEAVKKYMDIFETSSPSYILMSAAEKCVDFLKNPGSAFDDYGILLNKFYNDIKKIKNIKVLKNDDITRIIIKADKLCGKALADTLRRSGIEPEGWGLNYVILISSVCDTGQGFDALVQALSNLPGGEKCPTPPRLPILPEKRVNSWEISTTEQCPLNKASGRICGEYIYAYPPGVPIIVPGEVISSEIIDYIAGLRKSGVNIISENKFHNNSILTKRQ